MLEIPSMNAYMLTFCVLDGTNQNLFSFLFFTVSTVRTQVCAGKCSLILNHGSNRHHTVTVTVRLISSGALMKKSCSSAGRTVETDGITSFVDVCLLSSSSRQVFTLCSARLTNEDVDQYTNQHILIGFYCSPRAMLPLPGSNSTLAVSSFSRNGASIGTWLRSTDIS